MAVVLCAVVVQLAAGALALLLTRGFR